jgi:hypothetical protein
MMPSSYSFEGLFLVKYFERTTPFADEPLASQILKLPEKLYPDNKRGLA